jgi:hypothetical protein
MTAVRQLKRRAAKRPPPRTVTVTIEEGDYAGWEATAKADFPARILADFDSGKVDRIITGLDAIIVDHNFPNADDELAASMAEVDPYAGLVAVAEKVFEAINKLPNR